MDVLLLFSDISTKQSLKISPCVSIPPNTNRTGRLSTVLACKDTPSPRSENKCSKLSHYFWTGFCKICQQLPVVIGISTAQSVWSSREAGLGPLIGALVHVKVSSKAMISSLHSLG